MSIYEYDETIKSLLYQFKGCYDYELSRVFLSSFTQELYLLYKNFHIVPVPSYAVDDSDRGYNHVIEIFKYLNLPMLDLLYKTKHHKQSDQNFEERKDVFKYIKIKNPIDLSNKKVLIVDDVYTTGSTMKTCIELIKTMNPKVIKVLVLSKTKDIKSY